MKYNAFFFKKKKKKEASCNGFSDQYINLLNILSANPKIPIAPGTVKHGMKLLLNCQASSFLSYPDGCSKVAIKPNLRQLQISTRLNDSGEKNDSNLTMVLYHVKHICVPSKSSDMELDVKGRGSRFCACP